MNLYRNQEIYWLVLSTLDGVYKPFYFAYQKGLRKQLSPYLQQLVIKRMECFKAQKFSISVFVHSK